MDSSLFRSRLRQDGFYCGTPAIIQCDTCLFSLEGEEYNCLAQTSLIKNHYKELYNLTINRDEVTAEDVRKVLMEDFKKL